MSTEAEALGERIAEMAAHLDAAAHRLLTDLRDYDRSNNWFNQGLPTARDGCRGESAGPSAQRAIASASLSVSVTYR
jgi:hypothetical protein